MCIRHVHRFPLAHAVCRWYTYVRRYIQKYAKYAYIPKNIQLGREIVYKEYQNGYVSAAFFLISFFPNMYNQATAGESRQYMYNV